MPDTEFDPERILRTLEREHVRYVVIGGLGAVLRGSPVLTQDVDVCPAKDPENLERLARALRSLQAKIRTDSVPEGLPFACDAAFLANVDLVNLVTPYGDIDVSFMPSGTAGYDDLVRGAEVLDLGNDLAPPIASLVPNARITPLRVGRTQGSMGRSRTATKYRPPRSVESSFPRC
jgi:hypothetical protein